MPTTNEPILRACAERLASHLCQAGFVAQLDEGSLREFQIKVALVYEGASAGFLIIYYAPKRQRLSLGTQELRRIELKPQLEAIWQMIEGESLNASPASGEPSVAHHMPGQRKGLLDEVEYYYSILALFRHRHFDFIELANAVERACIAIGQQPIRTDTMRFDFSQLEARYQQLKEHR